MAYLMAMVIAMAHFSFHGCILLFGGGQLSTHVDDWVFFSLEVLEEHSAQARLWHVCVDGEGVLKVGVPQHQ